MIVNANLEWAKIVAPNLPEYLLHEYIKLLCQFNEQTKKLQWRDIPIGDISINLNDGTGWVFPFVSVDNTFPYWEYEEWTEMVEQDICQRYNLLPIIFET